MQIDRKLLLGCLRVVLKATEPKSSMPALQEMLIEFASGLLTIQGTNVRTHAALTLTNVAEGEPFRVTIHPKALIAYLAKSKADTVSLELPENSILVRVGAAHASFERGVREEDRPAYPRFAGSAGETWFERSAEWVEKVLTFVAPAICRDETRFHLNHLLVDHGNFVAIDGHRLHLVNYEDTEESDYSRLISFEAVELLRAGCKLAHPGIVTFEHIPKAGYRISIQNHEFRLVILESLSTCGNFPPYQQVVPRWEGMDWFIVGVRDLRNSATAAKAVIGRDVDQNGLWLKVEPKSLTLSVDGFGEMIPLIAASPKPAALKTAVNVRYLLDALNGLGKKEDVWIGYTGPLDALLVRGCERGSHQAVLMPMRK